MSFILGLAIGFVAYVIVMVTYNVITLKRKQKQEKEKKESLIIDNSNVEEEKTE